jgi:hypothetical protein
MIVGLQQGIKVNALLEVGSLPVRTIPIGYVPDRQSLVEAGNTLVRVSDDRKAGFNPGAGS